MNDQAGVEPIVSLFIFYNLIIPNRIGGQNYENKKQKAPIIEALSLGVVPVTVLL